MADKATVKLEKVRFVYQKARHHRTLHADGVWATVTPQLEVQFALFNDLKMMPNEVTHLVNDEGDLGVEVEREMPNDLLLREVDVTVVISKETAKNTIELLGRMIKQIEDHLESQVPQPTKEKDDETSKVS